LDLAKYLGEGTSRKEAEEKSSAFFICAGVFLWGNRERMLLTGDIEAKAGVLETFAPLLRRMDASPQAEMFPGEKL
jgi:hypothetical protein